MIKTRASHLARASTMNEVEYIAEALAERQQKKTMDIGTIIHSLILEDKLPDTLEVLDFNDYRTKASQEARDNAYNNGKIPFLKKDIQEYLELDLNQVKALFTGYDVEVAKAMNYNGHIITGHLDAFNGQHVRDLKVTNVQTFKNPQKEIFYRGYDIQVYLYMRMTQTQTASIVFFNLETQMFQEIDMHLNDIKDSCIQRINKAFQNIMAFEDYKNGKRQLESLPYYPY